VLLAAVAGAATVFAFAPFGLPLLALVTLAADRGHDRHAWQLAWAMADSGLRISWARLAEKRPSVARVTDSARRETW
jgi:hypothetical protein